eukprot:4501549-Pyramimonas_sp.AAC.1
MALACDAVAHAQSRRHAAPKLAQKCSVSTILYVMHKRAFMSTHNGYIRQKKHRTRLHGGP